MISDCCDLRRRNEQGCRGAFAFADVFAIEERHTVHQSVLERVDAEEDKSTCNTVSIASLR